MVISFTSAGLKVAFKDLPEANVVASVAIAVFFVVHMIILKVTKCPRCGGGMWKAVARAMRQRADNSTCPHCGVSFDEPMEGPRLPPSLDAIVTIRKCVEVRAAKESRFSYLGVLAMLCAMAAPNGSVSRFAAITCFLVCLIIAIWLINRTPCPKCNRPLGWLANRIAWRGSKDSDRCKNCGTGVDDQMAGPISS